MASDNLNRVFIKAYGKGKATVGNASNLATNGEQSNDWIVRFDTATVQSAIVPQMHNQRPPLHEAALVQPTRSPTPKHSPQKRHLSATIAVDLENKSGPAVQSLETPSLSSGSFSSGSLMLPGIDLTEFLGGTTMIVPQVSLGRRPPSDNLPNRDQDISVRPSAITQPTADPMRADQDPGKANPVLIAKGSSQLSQNSSLSAQPAKPSDDQTENRRVQPQAKPVNPLELEQQIAAKNKSGEIFRLDRPSYAAAQHPLDVFADEQASSPSEESSLTAQMLGELKPPQDVHQQTATNGPSRLRGDQSIDTGFAQSRHSNQHVKEKELDLRSARVRVFNPLWEVDRLEWPRVCFELMSVIDSKSSEIADNLLNACQEGLQVLAVTSPLSGAGTSTVACCLAMVAGRHGLKIALVDGNMENPSLCYQTNLELEVDWHEAVARKMPLEEVAVHSVDDQVTLVPLLARLSAPQLNEQNIAKMLTELSQSFDLVVVDVGHMASSRNIVTALGDLGAINAVIAVVDRRNDSAERIESCLRQIRQTGIASIGLVENFAA